MSIKNRCFSLVSYLDPVIGRTCYRLINLKSGETAPFFTEYLKKKAATGAAANSVKSAAYDLLNFFSYLLIASEIIQDLAERESATLANIFFSYPQFLMLGKFSTSELARQTADRLDATTVSNNSKNRMLSSVQGFIRESANYQKTLNELSELRLINVSQTPKVIGEELMRRRPVTHREKKKLIHNSYLAGCISGGVKYVDSSFFKFKGAHIQTNTHKAYPLNCIIETINNARSFRDRALWSLLVGTGIRVSEAFNVLIEDIDGLSGEVIIVDPSTRLGIYPQYETPITENLKFKGRTTDRTYFLEPFKEIFLSSLKRYLERERPALNHDVLFVNLSSHENGRPLYMAKNANTYNKAFKNASAESGAHGYTLHSLRHLYGVYALNYLPTDSGFGLPIQTVQLMMGHASVESTKKYAIRDAELVRRIISQFNQSVMELGLSWEDTANQAKLHTL